MDSSPKSGSSLDDIKELLLVLGDLTSRHAKAIDNNYAVTNALLTCVLRLTERVEELENKIGKTNQSIPDPKTFLQ